jgi:hypothetical protein
VTTISGFDFPDGLRALADYLGELPEIPRPENGLITVALPGPDLHAYAAMDRAEQALKGHDLPFDAGTTGSTRYLQFTAGPVTYRIVFVPAPAWDIARVMGDTERLAVTV